MIGNVLQADLQEIIRAKNWDELREAFSELPAADIAEVLIDLPAEEEGVVFRVLPREQAGVVFSYLPLDRQEELLHSFSNEQVRGILGQMTPDDRTRLLEELPAEVTRKLLDTLPPDELKLARELLGYPQGSAARSMTPRYASVPPDVTAREALEYIRQNGRGKETLAIVYVVDAQGKLVEEVRLGALVMADPNMKVVDIEDRPRVSIPATAGRQEILDTFKKYDRVAMPVTDADDHMLGIITVDDVVDVAEREATKEIQRLGGSEALDKPYLEVSFWDMVKKRGGWLAVLFLGEMLTATAMGYFENEIERAAVVALFVPLIISSGGNSGSQGTSLIIRSLALKELRLRDWWRVFGRELRTGLALGLFLGIIGFCRIGAWQYLSQVPHIGAFFQTHSGQDTANIPSGMKMVTGEQTLSAAVPIPAYTLPVGAEIQKGTLLPQETTLPAEVQTALPSSEKPTAYGKFWFRIGITVFAALIGVVAWGSLAGSMLPFILRKVGFDPATSSAPFVATLVDVTGLIIYFCVAKVVLTGTLL
jgi:magnesium transporter